jgi:hypothetical protein
MASLYGSSSTDLTRFCDNSPAGLIEIFLRLPPDQREEYFVSTSNAARMVGVSRRTIQLWIEGGLIAALLIGGRYYVCVPSLKSYLREKAEHRALG